jgi:hypothetical protein
MYLNKTTINNTATANGGSNFSTTRSYWSSTEYDSQYNPWYRDFDDGFQNYDNLSHFQYRARAVRAF